MQRQFRENQSGSMSLVLTITVMTLALLFSLTSLLYSSVSRLQKRTTINRLSDEFVYKQREALVLLASSTQCKSLLNGKRVTSHNSTVYSYSKGSSDRDSLWGRMELSKVDLLSSQKGQATLTLTLREQNIKSLHIDLFIETLSGVIVDCSTDSKALAVNYDK